LSSRLVGGLKILILNICNRVKKGESSCLL
jgi:hypothetical protein